MRIPVTAVSVAAMMAASASVSAEEAPSNAELFRMIKEQQKTISELRTELSRAREARRVTRGSDARPGAQEVTVAASFPPPNAPIYTKAVAKPEPNRFTITGEYLWLRPGVGDTSFVINSPISTTFPNGTRENNDFDFGSAYRIGAAYEFGGSHRKIMASYTHLDQSETRSVNGNFLWATVGRADFASSFENYAGTAAASIDVKYDRVDVLFSEPFKWSDARLALLYGVEYAKIDLNENYAFVNAGTTGTVWNSSNLTGFGPQIGLSLDYDLFGHSMGGVLSLNVVTTGSLLLASADVNTNNVLGGATILSVNDEKTRRVIPALHMRAGLTYDFPVASYVTASLAVGYEYHSYIGGLTRNIYPDDVADGLVTSKRDNFDLSGPFASFSLKF